MLNSNILKEKKISAFMTYADFESILVPEDNGNQNPNEFYTNNYQKHVACSYGYNYQYSILIYYNNISVC